VCLIGGKPDAPDEFVEVATQLLATPPASGGMYMALTAFCPGQGVRHMVDVSTKGPVHPPRRTRNPLKNAGETFDYLRRSRKEGDVMGVAGLVHMAAKGTLT